MSTGCSANERQFCRIVRRSGPHTPPPRKMAIETIIPGWKHHVMYKTVSQACSLPAHFYSVNSGAMHIVIAGEERGSKLTHIHAHAPSTPAHPHIIYHTGKQHLMTLNRVHAPNSSHHFNSTILILSCIHLHTHTFSPFWHSNPANYDSKKYPAKDVCPIQKFTLNIRVSRTQLPGQ